MLCTREIPANIHRTCFNWYESPQSAMYAVWNNEPFCPVLLEKEVKDIIKGGGKHAIKDNADLLEVKAFAYECSLYQRLEADIKKLVAKYPDADKAKFKNYVDKQLEKVHAA